MPIRKCTSCGSTNLLNQVQVTDGHQVGKSHLLVGLARNPNAAFFDGMVFADVYGDVCDDCGHLQLHVPNRDELREVSASFVGSVNLDRETPGAKFHDCPKCGTSTPFDNCPDCGTCMKDIKEEAKKKDEEDC